MSAKRAFVCLLLLASVYLLYWPHAELVSDDWLQLQFYRDHQVRGFAGEIEVARTLMQNRLYPQFQVSWLSHLIDSLVIWTAGYAPRLLYTLALLVHFANAFLFYRLLVRLRVAASLAFAAAACFLMIPTAHNVLFWFLNNGFYRLPPLFLLLFWLSLVRTLDSGRLAPRAACWQALLVLTVLFSGGAPSFHLLFFAGPWIAVCFFPRDRWKLAAQATALHWTVLALALAVYVRFGSAIPPDVGARYDFSADFFLWNARNSWGHVVGMARTYSLEAVPLAAALLAFLVVVLGMAGGLDPGPARRVPLFAAGMLLLACGPLLFLVGRTLRHYYTLSPYLALLLMSLVWMLPVRRLAAGLICAWFAAGTVAEMRESWIPQSRHVQALKTGLRSLRHLEPGDRIVIPGTPWVIGSAQNFVLIINAWAGNFARHVTGVRDLEFWREIVVEQGLLRYYHRATMRTTSPEEISGRTHILVGPPEGPYRPAQYWVDPRSASQRPQALKDGDGGEAVYTPKPFDPHHPQYRLY